MLRWLGALARGRTEGPTRETLLNEALGLAMDWGEDWLAPTQPRMAQRHPRLGAAELDTLNATAQSAMARGHELAYEMVATGAAMSTDAFAQRLRESHPWLAGDTAERLFRQSVYYACKTGGPPRRS